MQVGRDLRRPLVQTPAQSSVSSEVRLGWILRVFSFPDVSTKKTQTQTKKNPKPTKGREVWGKHATKILQKLHIYTELICCVACLPSLQNKISLNEERVMPLLGTNVQDSQNHYSSANYIERVRFWFYHLFIITGTTFYTKFIWTDSWHINFRPKLSEMAELLYLIPQLALMHNAKHKQTPKN